MVIIVQVNAFIWHDSTQPTGMHRIPFVSSKQRNGFNFTLTPRQNKIFRTLGFKVGFELHVVAPVGPGDSVILSGETQVILLFIFPVVRLLKLLRYFESFRLLVAAWLVVRKVDAVWHRDFMIF